MSTTLNQHKIIPSNSLQNTRVKSNKTDNNTNKTPPITNNKTLITNSNDQHTHSNNPPKISLRTQANKKQQSRKDLQSNKQQQNKGKSISVLSQKQKDSQINSNYSLNKKQFHQSQGYSEDNNLTRKETKQYDNKKEGTDKYKNNGNKIHFYPHNKMANEAIDNDNKQRNKPQNIQYQIQQGNYPTIPNNLPLPKYFNPYTHHHINSSSNINQYHKIQYPNKDSKPGQIPSTKQDSIQNSTNNNSKPLYHTDKQHFYQSQNPNMTQNSNQKSLNSMSVTREELNCSQSVKNSNSSSFYDNHTSFNTITPLNSYNSLQYCNDSYHQSPTHYHFKNTPKTQFLNSKTNQSPNNYQNLQNKNVYHFQNNLSVPQNPNYLQNFSRHQQHNDQNVLYKNSFPINSSSSSKTMFQTNSKSNLTIRNLEYGRNIQPVQRTKSHTKHYSNANFEEYHKIPPSIQDTQNVHHMNFPIQNSPHYVGKQNTNNFQPNQHNSYFNQTHLNPSRSNNPYIINLISNINKSTDKALQLDSIAEKDEFGKVFTRGNQKINEKSQSAQSNKYIQRQQDSSTKGTKNKINIISDSLKPQHQGPTQYIHVNQGPNFTNVKYIKNQTNNEPNNKPQYIQVESQKIKNCDKYLKVNYQPLLKNQRVSEHFFRQNEKNETHSVNSSFKENKSQTRSLHGNTKSRNQSIHDFNQYEKQRNMRYKSNLKRQNEIQLSSSKNNLYQANTLPNQNKFNFDKSTTKTKIDSQNDPMSYSYGAIQNTNPNHYQSNFYPNTQFNETRFTSPDSKQFVRSGHQNPKMYTSQQDYTGQKLTIFSPKQRDLRPAQKNHFIQQEESQKYRESIRQKKSIKKMLVSQSKGLYSRPQVLVSLNFKDLLKGQPQQGRPNSRTLLQAITKNHLTKVFCSTFKIGENQNGCDCIPKCYWVDQWLEIINNDSKLKEKSLMKNIDRNKVFTFSGQNLWKNKSKSQTGGIKNQITSFTDMNNFSHLNADEIETFKQIEKDVPRTFSSHPTFKNQRFRDFLREVLINSYYLDTKLGYVQGMNIISASIIYHSKTTQQALQLVDLIMNVLDFKKIYMNDMRKCRDLAAKTCQIIRINCYDMYSHVVIDNQVDLEMFIVGWYFSMLGTFVPLEAMHFVINKFIQKQFGGIMKIIVTFFIFIKDILMQKNDPNQIMQELSVQSMIDRSTKIDWNELISVSDKLKLTFDKQEL